MAAKRKKAAAATVPERPKFSIALLGALASGLADLEADYHPEAVEVARLSAVEGELEIDDVPLCSRGDEGTYVQCWLFVPKERL